MIKDGVGCCLVLVGGLVGMCLGRFAGVVFFQIAWFFGLTSNSPRPIGGGEVWLLCLFPISGGIGGMIVFSYFESKRRN